MSDKAAVNEELEAHGFKIYSLSKDRERVVRGDMGLSFKDFREYKGLVDAIVENNDELTPHYVWTRLIPQLEHRKGVKTDNLIQKALKDRNRVDSTCVCSKGED